MASEKELDIAIARFRGWTELAIDPLDPVLCGLRPGCNRREPVPRCSFDTEAAVFAMEEAARKLEDVRTGSRFELVILKGYEFRCSFYDQTDTRLGVSTDTTLAGAIARCVLKALHFIKSEQERDEIFRLTA